MYGQFNHSCGIPMYNWGLARPEEFRALQDLFCASGIWSGEFHDIQRRVVAPLSIKHLISFKENDGNVIGFVTFAFMNDAAEKHMPTTGILPMDWKSGDNFWVVDFIVSPEHDGYKMLRSVTKGLGVKKARYFRHRNKEIREVRVLQ